MQLIGLEPVPFSRLANDQEECCMHRDWPAQSDALFLRGFTSSCTKRVHWSRAALRLSHCNDPSRLAQRMLLFGRGLISRVSIEQSSRWWPAGLLVWLAHFFFFWSVHTEFPVRCFIIKLVVNIKIQNVFKQKALKYLGIFGTFLTHP